MVDRDKGDKSYVRIAKSSKEQDGMKHRTRPVPAFSPGPVAPGRHHQVTTRKLESQNVVSRESGYFLNVAGIRKATKLARRVGIGAPPLNHEEGSLAAEASSTTKGGGPVSNNKRCHLAEAAQ
jgi:hypothetical protein